MLDETAEGLDKGGRVGTLKHRVAVHRPASHTVPEPRSR